jgi:hypothetical protein
MPRWRRYELRRAMQEAAEARGETMTREDADYGIDKALATGALDADGNEVTGECGKSTALAIIARVLLAALIALVVLGIRAQIAARP